MELLLSVASSLAKAAILLAGCVIIEHIATIERYTLRQRIPGILMNFIGTAGLLALLWPLNRLWHSIGIGSAITIPLWDWLSPLGLIGYILQFLAILLLADFFAYWRHRAEHKWFWPIHAVHHSPRELHAANDIGHPLQALTHFAFVLLPLSLIQVDGPAAPIAVGLTVTFLSYYAHSPIDFHFGPMGRVVVDNRYHRIHHSIEPRHRDKNFGICFSFWDILFGTAHHHKPGEWPKVGVEGVPQPTNLKSFLMMPFRLEAPRDNHSGVIAGPRSAKRSVFVNADFARRARKLTDST